MLTEETIVVKCPIVAILVGNAQVPFPKELSIAGQFKKLILAIRQKLGHRIKKLVVLTCMPRLDKEVELEEEVKKVNNGIFCAVCEVKRHHQAARHTGVLPMHRLFLERYEYFDFGMGRTAYQIRVIKPTTLFFQSGKVSLNSNGIYHLRSYVLQELGILSGVNSWDGMSGKAEPVEIQESKRQAWLKTRDAQLEMSQSADEDTDVEDEYPIVVVPDSLSDGSAIAEIQSSSESGTLPVYVQGKRIVSGHVRRVLLEDG